MTEWTRQEWIDALRGVLQFLGMLIMVACIVMVMKYRTVLFHDCGWKTENGTVESTGLYGNCSYIDKFKPSKSIANLEEGQR